MFRRLINVIKGWFGLAVSGMEKMSPDALLEVEKENLRSAIVRYNQGLVHHATMCKKLMNQIKREGKESEDCKVKAQALLRAGKKEEAGRYALQFKSLKRSLEENRAQLADAEKAYQEMFKNRDEMVKVAKKKIEALQKSVGDLKMKKAEAELSEIAAGLATQSGEAGETMSRLHDMVEDEKAKAEGRSQVSKDTLKTSPQAFDEITEKALADQALADLAAEEGISLEGPSVGGSAENKRTMGPQSESES